MDAEQAPADIDRYRTDIDNFTGYAPVAQLGRCNGFKLRKCESSNLSGCIKPSYQNWHMDAAKDRRFEDSTSSEGILADYPNWQRKWLQRPFSTGSNPVSATQAYPNWQRRQAQTLLIVWIRVPPPVSWLFSSMAEHPAVNRKVVGSSPTGAFQKTVNNKKMSVGTPQGFTNRFLERTERVLQALTCATGKVAGFTVLIRKNVSSRSL